MRPFIARFWFMVVGLLLWIVPGCTTRRNLVLVTVDTLRRDAVGVYSDRVTWTPSLDSLAREGSYWVRAVAPFSMTHPSHATMMTGLSPAALGIGSNDAVLTEDVRCLAEELSAKGYTCAGLVNTWVLEPPSGMAQGFAAFRAMHAESLLDREHSDKGPHAATRFNPRASRTVATAKRWLRRGERPFFLWVHLMDPHLDYEPPAEEMRRFGIDSSEAAWGTEAWLKGLAAEGHTFTDRERQVIRALYDAEVASVDRALGDLFAELRTLGLDRTTVVAVVSDHGESILDDGTYVGHARSLHETVTDIPLIIAGPGVPRGKRFASCVELVQLAPTLLGLVEGRRPRQGDLFTSAERVGVTGDSRGRLCAWWRGWRLVWDPLSPPTIVHRGEGDSAEALAVMDSALNAHRMAREAPRRALSHRDTAALNALGYLEETTLPSP